MVGIKEEDIGGAGSAVGDCDGLGFIIEVGECVAGGACLVLHLGGAVLGVRADIIAADTNDGESALLVFAGELSESTSNVNYEGAVVAHEDHAQWHA